MNILDKSVIVFRIYRSKKDYDDYKSDTELLIDPSKVLNMEEVIVYDELKECLQDNVKTTKLFNSIAKAFVEGLDKYWK